MIPCIQHCSLSRFHQRCLSESLYSQTPLHHCTQAHIITVHSLSLTPRSLPGQIPHADLGALPVFLVYRYTMRLPGVRDLNNMMQSLSTAFEVCIRHYILGHYNNYWLIIIITIIIIGVWWRSICVNAGITLTVWSCLKQCCRKAYGGTSGAAPSWPEKLLDLYDYTRYVKACVEIRLNSGISNLAYKLAYRLQHVQTPVKNA